MRMPVLSIRSVDSRSDATDNEPPSEEESMKRSPRPRTTANLSDSIHHRLNMYALAASAAGVGVLALAQPIEAKIVYTPADVKIGYIPYNLDLNHDGVVDFQIET